MTKSQRSLGYAAWDDQVAMYSIGEGSGFFTITEGNVEVDQIHIYMGNNEDEIVFEGILPVS